VSRQDPTNAVQADAKHLTRNRLLRKPESARLAVCDHAATSSRGGVVGQDELPAEDMAALRQAILDFYEESIGPLVAQRRGRGPRRLLRNRRLRWLNVLLLPVLLIDLVRMAVAHRGPELMVRQQRAVSLYRQLSSKDPHVAQAEVWRIHGQLAAIDQRVKAYSAWLATADPADRAELAAAAGALLAYHLGGRQTDDALLGQIQAAWAQYEALGEQRKEQMLGRVARGAPPSPKEITREERAAMDRYVAGWRSWFDQHAEQDGSPDRDD
jgi:hypothetical protein